MSTFHQVLGLWLAPDFSAVQRGELPPPHVDFDAVDADSLAGAIAAFNECGENVTVRVPNDAIDQVTVHYRMTGRMPGSAKCDDFADKLLRSAETVGDLDVRRSWATLHALPNRRQAPPPVLLMFVVSGDFEAVMVWSHQFIVRLGIRAADISKQLLGNSQGEDYQGHLPDELGRCIGRTFGIAYRPECLVTGLASSRVPR
ncbi:hypothetical protein [Caballeronia zhejiangensis]|uniref:hypothetical protein n=1 Tax=Caballeronia zhejiangensis TaxID=871203 RepID=UPI001FD626E7|nr:hypothetical protein [Caballeronia zhejiangensis]